MRSYKESGTPLKADVSIPLLLSIFNPASALHDGAVIIQNDIIESAGCILPLSESTTISPYMATRHRAGLGLSEETDAIIIVVSEETGKISVAEEGRFPHIGLDEMELRRYLNSEIFISSCLLYTSDAADE